MKKPNFPYPENPPPWLEQWPVRQDIDRQFSLGVRNTAKMVGQRENIRRLEWTDTTLELILGTQRPVWSFDGETWRRSCTCGYPDAACVHCWLAAFLFEQVCRAEGWETGGKAGLEKSGAPPKKSAETPPRENSGWRQKEHGGNSQPDLFSSPVQYSSNIVYEDQPVYRRLEVEADFHYQPGRVAIRFYSVEDEHRRLMKMQEIQRLGSRFQQGCVMREQWPEEDREFLKWLYQEYRNKTRRHSFPYSYPYYYGYMQSMQKPEEFPELRLSIEQNLNILKIFESRFAKWQELWRHVPGRFIERDSQKPLGAEAETCSLHFEVYAENGMIRVAALVMLPDGTRYHFHEIFKMLSEGKKKVIIDGRILDFTPPVSWKILTDFFSRKSPGIPLGKVEEYLPTLIQNRFDLLEGEILQKKKETESPVEVSARADGGDVLLSFRMGEAFLHPGVKVPTGGLRELKDGRLALTIYESPVLSSVQEEISRLPLIRVGDSDSYRLRGQMENVSRFLQFWHHLPAAVKKDYSSELAPLLAPDFPLQPMLTFARSKVFIDLRLSWRSGDASLEDSEVSAAIGRSPPVARSKAGYWLTFDAERVKNIRRIISESGFGRGSRLRLFWPDTRKLLLNLQTKEVEYQIASRDRKLHEEIINQPEPQELPLPPRLEPVMRGYQKEGFEFLSDRLRYRIGAILADDMGLGKTLQMLALLQAVLDERRRDTESSRRSEKPLALVVCPASVSSVWLDECAKFAPDINCAVFSGPPERRQGVLQQGNWDLLVANYALVRNDIRLLENIHFEIVILDEAQQIKNPEALVSQAVKRLRSDQRLALTGTPLENRLLDMWSIMDFLNPEYLESREKFLKAGESAERAARLGRQVAPLMLRRTKDMVARELPERIDEVIRVEMSESQREFYDQLLEETREQARNTNTAVEMLALLTRLRQACCHPLLIRDRKHQVEESAKHDALVEMLEELLAEGHSILVFSQFVRMLKLIEADLTAKGLPAWMITGSTPVEKRSEIVRDFNQSEDAGIFLLSLKAAGTGLTLTKADYVFIFDPWWNPAVENQAIDRTHRIGQTKSVVAYRLVAADTIEDKVLAMQKHKSELFENLVADTESEASVPLGKMSADELRTLLE